MKWAWEDVERSWLNAATQMLRTWDKEVFVARWYRNAQPRQANIPLEIANQNPGAPSE